MANVAVHYQGRRHARRQAPVSKLTVSVLLGMLLGCVAFAALMVLSGGFYFDMAPPTRINLCSQSCLRAGAAAEMQVVLVLACTTAP